MRDADSLADSVEGGARIDWTAVAAKSKIRPIMDILTRRLPIGGFLLFSLSVAATGVQVLDQPQTGTAIMLPAPLLERTASTPIELVRAYALEADVVRWFAAHAEKKPPA
jgi:hypothetical protein